MASTGASRRDFLRGLFGRAARAASDEVPEAVARAVAAAEVARDVPTDSELRRAFAVPDDQRDVADALVARGVLRTTADGRYIPPGLLAPRVEGVIETWVERTAAGRPLQRTTPREAILLDAVRTELAPRRTPPRGAPRA